MRGIKENPSLGIAVCHDWASLVMPNGDFRDGFSYSTLKLMVDYYILKLKYTCKYINVRQTDRLASVYWLVLRYKNLKTNNQTVRCRQTLNFRFYFSVLLSEEKHLNFGMFMESRTHRVSCKVSKAQNFAKDLNQIFFMIP